MKTVKYIMTATLASVTLIVLVIGYFLFQTYSQCFFQNYNSVESVRTRLINNIVSYQNTSEFELYLSSNNLKWEKETESPFEKIYIKNYEHHGFYGELVIEFFNNRLMNIVFYTKKTDFFNYITILKSKEEIRFNEKRANVFTATLEPYTLIIANREPAEGKTFVKWLDTRLDNEFKKWEICHD